MPTTTSISEPTCRGRSSSTTTLAARAFRGEPAVGKRLFLRITTPEPEWYDIIGVVAHQRHSSLALPGPEAIFILDGHFGHGFAGRWAVRTSGDPRQVGTARCARPSPQIDPRAALAEVQPMQAFVDRAMAPVRFTTTLIGIFAAVAVVLAARRSLRRAVDDRAPADGGDRHADGRSARRAPASFSWSWARGCA